MTDKYRPFARNASVPVYAVNEAQANAAYDAYRALQLTAATNPHLLTNEYFIALQDTAYARFLAVFEAL